MSTIGSIKIILNEMKFELYKIRNTAKMGFNSKLKLL